MLLPQDLHCFPSAGQGLSVWGQVYPQLRYFLGRQQLGVDGLGSFCCTGWCHVTKFVVPLGFGDSKDVRLCSISVARVSLTSRARAFASKSANVGVSSRKA